MKIVNLILCFLFLSFAIVQYNDPDPWLWVLFYGFIAGISAFAIFNKYNLSLLKFGLAVAIFWMLTLIPDFIRWLQMGMPTIAASMKAEAPHIELTREFLGLLICISALVFHYYRSLKIQQ